MNEAYWAIVGALGGALLAGGMSLAGVRLTLRQADRRAEQARGDAQRSYLRDRRREAYGNFITAMLDAETRIDMQGESGDRIALTAAEIQALQVKVVHAQGSMMMFGSDAAVRASSRAVGEIIGGLRGISGPTGSREGLAQLVAIARDEFGAT